MAMRRNGVVRVSDSDNLGRLFADGTLEGIAGKLREVGVVSVGVACLYRQGPSK